MHADCSCRVTSRRDPVLERLASTLPAECVGSLAEPDWLWSSRQWTVWQFWARGVLVWANQAWPWIDKWGNGRYRFFEVYPSSTLCSHTIWSGPEVEDYSAVGAGTLARMTWLCSRQLLPFAAALGPGTPPAWSKQAICSRVKQSKPLRPVHTTPLPHRPSKPHSAPGLCKFS